MQPKVLNIPAGEDFAKTLAQVLLQETESYPQQLATYQILLPTRRACRVLRDSFISLNEGKSILLPRMTPLGDVEEEDLSLLMFGANMGFLDIPPAIPPLKRQIMLARMIAANPSFGQGMDQALKLAQTLGRFMDQVIIEGLDFADLAKIVPTEFADHWKITIEFLKIITEYWPQILAEHNLIEAAERRNLLLEALGQYWQKSPPKGPVIAAGSTGSVPATARLLGIISRLPQGRVILPGLDLKMDDLSWGYVGETHPQYGLKLLLERIGIERAQIRNLHAAEEQCNRLILASEIMRPAQTTQGWKTFAQHNDMAQMLNGLEYYVCQTQQEEAQVIALILRETLQQKEKTAALITPDRALAQRVSALCRRWGIEVDDSAGLSLRESGLGKYALLCLKALKKEFDPVLFLALLKNEFCHLDENDEKDPLAAIEIDFLRKDYIFPDVKTLQQKIQNKSHYTRRFIENFIKAAEPLVVLVATGQRQDFSAFMTAHLQVMENLSRRETETGAAQIWAGDMGEAGAAFFLNLQQQTGHFPPVTFAEYGDILDVLMQNITIRTPYGVHPRLLILGQLEARLTAADVIVLGGLNEKVWPPDIGHDPWLSRPMRKAFGLPPQEKGIGLAAHDFVQGFCASHVVMTRAARIDATPSVPARWLQRLEAILKACGRELSDLSLKPYSEWAQVMDHHSQPQSYGRPAPRPPVSARPDGISITRVEKWVKDPYSIYAHDILSLRKLNPLVQDSDAALRGTVLHEILDIFTKTYPFDLPEDAEDRLIEIAQNVLAEKLQDQGMLRFWWPRFLRIAAWYVQHERQWRTTRGKFVESELEGNADLDIDGQIFNLQGKPDRIDRVEGGYGIIDYKSGSEFSQGKLKAGELPQLPLAAMVLTHGGFDGKGLRNKPADQTKKRVPAAPVAYLGYWKMSGGKTPGEDVFIAEEIHVTVDAVEEGLKGLVRAFRMPETAYLSVPDTNNAPRYNDYEHLARLKEWAALDEASEEEAA